MSLGPWQLIIIALVVLVLFGRGRISEMMGDFGKGIKSFKTGMSEDVDAETKSSGSLEAPTEDPAATDASKSKASDPS